MSAPEPLVAICTPVYDTYDPRFIRSLRFLQIPGDQGMILEAHGKLLDDARREMTAQALTQPQVTHLLWVDADMTFAPDALLRLLARQLPIVGGLCFERRSPYNPALVVDDHVLENYPRDMLVRVDATGGGFLLTQRKVYEAISAKYGARSWWVSTTVDDLSNTTAGDVSFLARAKACGFDTYVDTSVKIGHIAKTTIDETFVDRWRRGAP